MKCPYPDCTGQVTPGEQFCGECGRSLTWENGQPLTVLASSGGPEESGPTGPMPILPPPPPITPPPAYGSTGEPPTYTPLNTYTPTPSPATPPDYSTSPETAAYTPPPATPPSYGPSSDTVAYTPQPAPPPGYPPPAAGPPPGYTPSAAPPPGYTPPPGYAPPGAVMSPAAGAPPAKSGPNPLVLILVGGGVGIVLLCMACFGLPFVLALLAPSATPTPVPPTRVVVRLPTATTRSIVRATATAKAPATVEAPATETPLLLSDTPVVPEGTEGPDPNATATAVASDFDIDFTDYQNSSGADVIVGTVHNKGTDRLENVKVTAELLDGSGAVVGTGDDILLPLAIMEGDQTLPFQVTIEEGNDTAERIHVKVNADVYDATGFRLFTPATGLTVEGATLADGILGPTLTGQVKNGGTKPATLVHVVAVGYDADGQVADTGTAYVTSDIATGESGQFELFFLRPDVKIVKYDATVIGQEAP